MKYPLIHEAKTVIFPVVRASTRSSPQKNHDFVVFTITLPEWFVECYLTWKHESWLVRHEKTYTFFDRDSIIDS